MAQKERVREPLIGRHPFRFGKGVDRLQGVIDNNEVATTAGQCAADRGCETETTFSGFHFALAVLDAPDSSRWKAAPVPVTFEDRPKVVVHLAGEVAGIADANDSSMRLMAENKGRQGHRSGNRLPRARWLVYDQPSAPAARDLFELMGNRCDRPTIDKPVGGGDRMEHLAQEASEVLPQYRVEHSLGVRAHGRSFGSGSSPPLDSASGCSGGVTMPGGVSACPS